MDERRRVACEVKYSERVMSCNPMTDGVSQVFYPGKITPNYEAYTYPLHYPVGKNIGMILHWTN